MKISKQFTSSLQLLLAAAIWGSAFAAQKSGMDYLGPYVFNGIRNFIGCIALIPCIILLDLLQEKKLSFTGTSNQNERKMLIYGGILCGVILFFASILQQIGLKYTTVGKAGFLTSLYVIIVPMLGITVGKKVGKSVWLCAFATTTGMYMLCCSNEGDGISKGDFLELLCALMYSFHILSIGYFSPKTDPVRMSLVQFLICGLISFSLGIYSEETSWELVKSAAFPLCYAGFLSSGAAFTLQTVAQKHVHPAIASLIMCLESVFSVFTGWLFMNETLTLREMTGCAIIFSAVSIVQIIRK